MNAIGRNIEMKSAVLMIAILAIPSASCAQDPAPVSSAQTVGSGRMLEGTSVPTAELLQSRRFDGAWLETEILIDDSAAARAYPSAVAVSTVFKVDCERDRYGYVSRRFYGTDGALLHEADLRSDDVVHQGPQWGMIAQVCAFDGQASGSEADFEGIDGFLRLAGSRGVEGRSSPPPTVVPAR